MMRYLVLALAFVGFCAEPQAQTPLRQSTQKVVRIGPAMQVANCTVPVTTLAVSSADEAELLKDTGGIVDISGATFAAITTADGWYDLTLTTSHTDTVGQLTVVINDDSLICPLFKLFQVYEEVVFDELYDSGAVGPLLANSTGSGLTALATQASVNTIDDFLDTEIADILTDTSTTLDDFLDTEIAAILVDTGTTLDDLVDDLESRLGTPSDFGSGTSTVAANLQDLADNGTAAFDRSTDSLQAIRDRGDAAWTGAGGGSASEQATTVASVTSQTILVPTATPTFVDQVIGWAVYLEDAGDADAYHLTYVTDYDQSTGATTIAEAAPFTVASTDVMVFLPAFMDQGVDVDTIEGMDATDQLDAHAAAGLDAAGVRTAIGLASANLDTQLTAIDDYVDTEVAAILVDTGTTLDDFLDTEVAAILSDTNAILVDTGTTLDDFIDTEIAALVTAVATVDTEVGVIDGIVDSILVDTGTTLDAALAVVDGNVDSILVDTGTTLQAELDGIQADTEDLQTQIGTDGAGLTNIPSVPVARYTNAAGDVCTFIISEATPKVTFDCTEAP